MVVQSNADLIAAFPASIREDVSQAVDALPENPHPSEMFSVRVAGEIVSIPQRIYHNPMGISVGFRLGLRSPRQKEVLNCLFTRHADGFVRQKRLKDIIRSNNIWIPPFVIQLAGEYVVEILRLIEQSLPGFDRDLYSGFVYDNPEFIERTKQRIVSYWDCYYRSIRREEYPGFRIQAFLEHLDNKKLGLGRASIYLKAKS